MKTVITAICVTALLATSATGYAADRRAECRKVKEKIRKIESRMRQGYTAKQGIRFDERLRELKKKRSELCR